MQVKRKAVDLRLLQSELDGAGIVVTGLGLCGGEDATLYTYDADGDAIPLPPEAVPIVAAHVPPPEPTKPKYGDDAPDDYPSRAADAVTSLRAYLGASNPTGAQTVAALKVVIRLVLYLARRTL